MAEWFVWGAHFFGGVGEDVLGLFTFYYMCLAGTNVCWNEQWRPIFFFCAEFTWRNPEFGLKLSAGVCLSNATCKETFSRSQTKRGFTVTYFVLTLIPLYALNQWTGSKVLRLYSKWFFIWLRFKEKIQFLKNGVVFVNSDYVLN